MSNWSLRHKLALELGLSGLCALAQSQTHMRSTVDGLLGMLAHIESHCHLRRSMPRTAEHASHISFVCPRALITAAPPARYRGWTPSERKLETWFAILEWRWAGNLGWLHHVEP